MAASLDRLSRRMNPASGEEHQGVVLSAVDVLDLQVVHGQEDAEAAGDVENELEERGERIKQERASEEGPAGSHQFVTHVRRDEYAGQAVPAEHELAVFFHEEIEEEHRKRHRYHNGLGQHRNYGLQELLVHAGFSLLS